MHRKAAGSSIQLGRNIADKDNSLELAAQYTEQLNKEEGDDLISASTNPLHESDLSYTTNATDSELLEQSNFDFAISTLLIDPSNLSDGIENATLAALIKQEYLKESHDGFKANQLYTLAGTHIQVCLSRALSDVGVNGEIKYLVKSDEPVPQTEVDLPGFTVRKIDGELIVANNQLIYEPKSNTYSVEGKIDFTSSPDAETQMSYAKLLVDMNRKKGVVDFVQSPLLTMLITRKGNFLIAKLELAHPIVCYKKPNHALGFIAYQGRALAEGTYRRTYDEMGRLLVRSDGHVKLVNALNKPKYVVKRSKPGMFMSAEALQGNKLSKYLNYLHSKDSILFYKEDGTVDLSIDMERKMPGDDLFNIIAHEHTLYKANVPLQYSTRKRLLLSRELCHALKEFHDYDLAHRDIKPENLVVESIFARLVDLGFSKKKSEIANTDQTMFQGTLMFGAPEALSGLRNDERSDIFSMAFVLAQLWGERRPKVNNVKEAYAYAVAPDFPHLFEIDDGQFESQPLKPNERDLFKHLLRRMSAEYKSRCSMDHAIEEEMDKIILNYYLSYSPVEQHESIKQIYHSALVVRKQLYLFRQTHKNEPLVTSNIRNLMGIISVEVDKLQNASREWVQIFVETLGIKAFVGIETVDNLRAKIKEVIDGFVNEGTELRNATLLAKKHLDANASRPLVDLAETLRNRCLYLADKAKRKSYTVDDIVEFNTKMKEGRLEEVVPLQTKIADLERVSKKRSTEAVSQLVTAPISTESNDVDNGAQGTAKLRRR